MILYQKLILLQAIGLTTINSNMDLNKIIAEYDTLLGNETLDKNNQAEVLDIFKGIINSAQPDYRNNGCMLASLLITKFPDWKKELLIIKIKLLINLTNMDEAVKNADDYINSFGLDKDIAILKLQALMSLNYSDVVEDIEKLMEYLKEQTV